MDAPASPPPVRRDRSAAKLRRLVAAIGVVGVVAAGLAAYALLPDTAVTDIAGDALYAVAVYAALVVVFPRGNPLLIGVIAAACCVAVELFQLTGIPLALGAEFMPAMLVLGTVFDLRDLVVYVVAITLVTAVDAVAQALSRAS